jgi:hypothetical protein
LLTAGNFVSRLALADGVIEPKRGRAKEAWTYERITYSPSKALRAEMGFSFRRAGCGKRTEEYRDESRNIKISGRR